ncbi:acyltransferase family protein [Actinoplanes derwentensis]|uniref:Peptidoglycan/LPS O-acetylase OafA/YrhL, contains acyltransferase and SGNH-hydrolase domains n=1 Tax=Actinoplanes derwentensis TaxID=113562 RepID=A0A1H2D567_9ACTN|nr:acyltransferase family protein [Actinoplanes derwentensis]GID87939.1 acyltransferase [Actinoplanes derwentensis]SDT77632.1 Peptidoglycan/LPS O-acetylase OafA/YrhL, contains acyltransferase and SGNH-hydrolase domains [Actinoplanes derwentensis]
MTATLTRRHTDPAPGGSRHAYRGDIEGLRAVAVLLVVLAHVGVPGVAGGFLGVDVFFVVSGFLITGLLRREIATTGRLGLARFYARRVVRLLPVATLVIVATLAGAWFWAPPVRFATFAADALAAATWTMNLRLDTAGTDYFGDPAPSPFQHFWSLAVEEQFYLLWPLLLLARSRVLLVAVTIASFAWSLHDMSYFASPGRAWELGAGALISLVTCRRRPWLGWAGLAAVVTAALVYDETTRWPGVAALVPVLGTVAIIAAGGNRLLETGPMRWLGRMSYGWYLWHWPLLVLAAPESLPDRAGAAALALGLAVLSHHLLENPVRRHRWWTVRPRRALGLGLCLVTVTAVLAAAGMLHPPAIPARGSAPDTGRAVATAGNPAARLHRLLVDANIATDLPRNLTPSFDGALRQRLAPQRDGCHVGLTGPFRPRSDCSYTTGRRTVVLFGDSHALQWFPTLDALARKNGWRLYNFTRSSCSPAGIAVDERRARSRYLECDRWRADVLARIARLRPALLVVSSSVNYRQVLTGAPADPDAVWQTGWVRTLAVLKRAAGQVVLLGDTPFLKVAPADCLSSNATNVSGCADPRAEVLPEPRWREIQRATAVAAGVPVIDPVPWLCADRCPLVVGDTMVYRDSNHLTEAYARLVAPVMEQNLAAWF